MANDLVRHNTQKKPPSAGVSRGHAYRGMMRTVVAFDPETHESIRSRAIKEGTSFAEQVRVLIEWGLMNDDE